MDIDFVVELLRHELLRPELVMSCFVMRHGLLRHELLIVVILVDNSYSVVVVVVVVVAIPVASSSSFVKWFGLLLVLVPVLVVCILVGVVGVDLLSCRAWACCWRSERGVVRIERRTPRDDPRPQRRQPCLLLEFYCQEDYNRKSNNRDHQANRAGRVPGFSTAARCRPAYTTSA